MGKFSKIPWQSYFKIALGCLIVTISMNLFLIPYKLAPGGVSGLSTVIYHLVDEKIPVGILMLAFNIPLFLTGYKKPRQDVSYKVFIRCCTAVFVN